MGILINIWGKGGFLGREAKEIIFYKKKYAFIQMINGTEQEGGINLEVVYENTNMAFLRGRHEQYVRLV